MVFKHFCIRSAELNVFGVEEMTLVSRGKESDVSQRFSHYSLVSGCELMSVDRCTCLSTWSFPSSAPGHFLFFSLGRQCAVRSNRPHRAQVRTSSSKSSVTFLRIVKFVSWKVSLSVCQLSLFVPSYLSVCLSVSVFLSVSHCLCLSAYLTVYLSVCALLCLLI